MALKPVIDSTDGLDEAIISLYAEADGKFELQLDEQTLNQHPLVRGLVTANKTNAEKAKERLAKITDLEAKIAGVPDDFDAEKWAKLKDGKPDEAAQIKLRQEYEAKITELEGKIAKTEETARKNAIERDLAQALTAVGVTDAALMRGAMAMLSPSVSVNEDGQAVIETDLGPRTPAEHLKSWAAGEGKAFVTAPKGGGSKSGDGSGGTITAEQFAKMGDKERTELFRSDPEKFKELTAP